MRLPIAMTLVSTMLLSGCWWEGPAFYTGNPADAAPIAAGLYRADDLGDRKGARTVRVIWLPNGSVSVIPQNPSGKEDIDISRAVLHRFDVPRRNLWVIQYLIDKEPGSAVYGMLERNGDTLSVIPFIDCDATADIVREAGGTVSGGTEETSDIRVARVGDNGPPPRTPPRYRRMNQTCSFGDRASFERALTAYMKTNPMFPTRIALKRIGD